ncbi:GIY-YIG nuclease family protein [Epilithonimonas mollis]|uniref:GIY-YIG catalytic domain-containing protein n=1 Tax=Epilithonimonas mollis TaxID=216903 RepID=A0A1M6MZM3_9FLAO|nr:hypothetical protein [Epilithonimonas mollis]SHJ88832.1 hypothetical protein SAMN05444371_0071 [Epilithonimonas mollis]
MNKTVAIINHFIKTQIAVDRIEKYSKLPGIYAIFFIGKEFPIKGFSLPDNKLIYIGKTESSQQSRDANTHFKTGKTGSSTARKSIGALLSQSEKIIPVVRSTSDFIKGRTSHFKFDEVSEERITDWMFKNLAVAFYEYPEGKEAICNLETELIQYLNPVLNIDSKSIDNPYKSFIRKLRKQLGLTAHTNYMREHLTLGVRLTNEVLPSKKEITPDSISVGKYVHIWQQYSDEIHKALKSNIIQNTIQLDRGLFEKVGNRKSYSFRLQYSEGKVSNNIGGSAVARDLDYFLTRSKIETKTVIIKLRKDFVLTITKI